MEQIDPARYPYTDADVEYISPADLREGDLLAGGGPQGSHVFAARRVEHAGWAGYSKSWGREVYRFRTEGMIRDQYYCQPADVRVCIVRRDLKGKR